MILFLSVFFFSVLQLNALANRAAGKGYENEDNYSNIRFQFVGIENIHVMRTSLQKLLEGYLPFATTRQDTNGRHEIVDLKLICLCVCVCQWLGLALFPWVTTWWAWRAVAGCGISKLL